MTVAIALLAAAFVVASIPFGYVVARLRGVDIRTVGSGNIGATNVLRSQGKAAGALVLLLDMGKGLAPVLAARALDAGALLPAAAAVAAVCGHCFSIFMKGRGGKGVATGLGAFLALAPRATLAALALFVAVVSASRYVSLGSMAAALVLPAAIALCGYGWRAAAAAAVTGLVIVARHRENIVRLVKGQESKLGQGRPRAASPKEEGRS